MPVIATDSTRFSAVVKMEFAPEFAYCRESAVLNDTAQTVKVGTVLGKVTANGKWKVCQTTAGDGSQTPAGIYAANGLGESADLVLAATTDTNCWVIARGPVILADAGLSYAATNAPTLSAVKTAFLAINNPILIETAV